MKRFIERAKQRDPALETDLFELFRKDEKDSSPAQFFLDAENYKMTAQNETRVFREYMVKEAI
jgi:hypothetical protein